MSFWLAVRYLRQSWLRSGALMAGLAAFVFIFATMAGVLDVMSGGDKQDSSSRLVIAEKDSGAWKTVVPRKYIDEVREMVGVKAASGFTLTGTDPGPDFLIGRAVDKYYLDVNTELAAEDMISKAHWQALLGTRQGVLVGDRVAKNRSWKVGDRIELDQWNDWPDLPLEIVGIVHHPEYKDGFILNLDYLTEAVPWFMQGIVQWIQVSTDDPAKKAELADRITVHFADRTTKVSVLGEDEFLSNLSASAGDMKAAFAALLGAALVAGFLTTLTPVSIAFRERMRTIAVLRSIGFPWPTILKTLGYEVGLLTGIAGVAGGLSSYFLFKAAGVMIPFGPVLVPLSIRPTIVVAAIGASLLIGFCAAVMPAVRALRMNVADVLTRLE